MRPTLFSPPKALSLLSRLSTTTGSGPWSAASVQPEPYRNGTSNRPKKSAVVTRRIARNGFVPLWAESTTASDLNMIALRAGMSDCCSATASR